MIDTAILELLKEILKELKEIKINIETMKDYSEQIEICVGDLFDAIKSIKGLKLCLRED